MNIGTTYSHRHAHYLGLDVHKGLKKIISMNLSPIRLCCYWNEIQPQKEVWNYSNIEALLKICESNKCEVVLAVGMKAPRWPEFHIPAWALSDTESLENNCVEFISKTIGRLKNYANIVTWQVENEPLDPSGPKNETIKQSTLHSEIETVKSIDSRPVMLTVWANTLNSRSCFSQASELGDIIGLDIYYKVPGPGIYGGPEGGAKKVESTIKACPAPVWITELQAEPWENKWTRFRNKSMTPDILVENYHKTALQRFENVLLWGSEFWLQESTRGNHEYLKAVNELVYQNAR